MTDHIFLFVYGTLKRGEPGHELMKNSRFVASVLKTRMKRVENPDYPSAIESEDQIDCVAGEIWAVPITDLPVLDEYEGDNYRRVQLRDSNLYAYLLKASESEKFAATNG